MHAIYYMQSKHKIVKRGYTKHSIAETHRLSSPMLGKEYSLPYFSFNNIGWHIH